MKNLFFVLGSPDQEMNAIEFVLMYLDIPYGYAIENLPKGSGTRRVRSNAAYDKNVGLRIRKPWVDKKNSFVVTVECNVPVWLHTSKRIDHHKEGDAGYDCDHLNFWKGSSLGQVIDFLEECKIDTSEAQRMYNEDMIIVAAADHCPAHAAAGECPGVDVEAFREYRYRNAARRSEKPIEAVRREIQRSIAVLEMHPYYMLENERIYMVYDSTAIPNLMDISLLAGLTVEYHSYQGAEECVGLRNARRSEVVTAWMKAKEGELTGIYGVPNRGYAGGYKKVLK